MPREKANPVIEEPPSAALPEPRSDPTPYILAKDAVAILGENGEKKLFDAHLTDQITLVAWRAGPNGTSGPIPKHHFANSVTLNIATNSIEPDGTVKDFSKFERNLRLDRWDDVQVRHTEIVALKKSLGGRTGSLASAETQCKGWLSEQMAHEKRRPKDFYRQEAQQNFKGLSQKGFDRAWAAAAQETGSLSWLKAGAPKRQ